jgi:protein phosphatase
MTALDRTPDPAATVPVPRLQGFGWTDVGRKRSNNEDFYAVLNRHELFLLADGMGGHASGEVASRLAVRHVIQYLLEICHRPGFVPAPDVPAMADPAERLVCGAILHANERVYVESLKDRRLDGMGTTLLIAMGAGDRVILAHVGDSRIYRLRDGVLERMTEDHSLLNHLLRTGQLTQEASRDFKGKNVIMKAVGLKDHVAPDIRSVERREGDLYLFCSDGLTDLVEDWIIQNVLASEGGDAYAATRALVRIANEYGGKDNTTVVLVRVGQPVAVVGVECVTHVCDPSTDKIPLASVEGRLKGDSRHAGKPARTPHRVHK